MDLTLPVALAVPPVYGFVMAAATDGTGGVNIPSIIGTTVTPVIVIILLLMGKLRTEPEVKRIEKSLSEANATVAVKDKQLQDLQAGLVDKAIPALTRTTLVLETIAPMLQTELHLRRPPSGGG